MGHTAKVAAVALSCVASWAWAGSSPPESKVAELGRALFFDPNLSQPAGRACASCHDPSAGFADPNHAAPTSAGAVAGRVGGRNAPSAAYAPFAPRFHRNAEGDYVGGYFWDGRADTLEAQAEGPLLNPVEMNQPNAEAVLKVIRTRPYAAQFRALFGSSSLDDAQHGLKNVAEAIAAFERSKAFSPFTSKYDAYLAGKAQLTSAEAKGLAVFEDPKKGNCAACHPSRPGADGAPPLFTDFTYDNVGVPKNPHLAASGVDLGLGGRLGEASENGKFKVPSLRNVAKTAPYMHNGYFENLADVVHFYNTRDVAKWPRAEVAETVNRKELGKLHLSEEEERDLVAFLQTLTDGYQVAPPTVARRR